MKKLLGVFLAVFATVSFARNVYAGGDFEATGASCVASDVAIQADSYLVTAGTVKHKGTNTDLIVLHCAIPQVIDAPTTLELLYQDSTGIAGTDVTVSYMKMHKSTGAVSTISSQSSSCASCTATTGTPLSAGRGIIDTYDPGNYRYYMKVELDRSTSSDTAIFYGATVY
ncbi:MAG: hypothetical protein H0U13_15640 [Gemmatimonadaceae bacterium]|nr:hypothetical protein [Gemmatimonadaceae bacterium]